MWAWDDVCSSAGNFTCMHVCVLLNNTLITQFIATQFSDKNNDETQITLPAVKLTNTRCNDYMLGLADFCFLNAAGRGAAFPSVHPWGNSPCIVYASTTIVGVTLELATIPDCLWAKHKYDVGLVKEATFLVVHPGSDCRPRQTNIH